MAQPKDPDKAKAKRPGVREIAKRVGVAGRTYPAVFNAANEQAVLAFHAGRIGYLDIVDTVERVVDAHSADEFSLESVFEAERWARAEADRLLTV